MSPSCSCPQLGLPNWVDVQAQNFWIDTKTNAVILAAFFAVAEGFRYNHIRTQGPVSTVQLRRE